MINKKEYMKEYHKKHKEKHLVLFKKYYEENKEKILKQKKEYHIKNRGTDIIKYKEYYQENKDKWPDKIKIWRKSNSEKVMEMNRRFQIKNPEYYNKYRDENREYKNEHMRIWNKTDEGIANRQRGDVKRQFREKGTINTLTSQEWLNILEKYNYRCFYCDAEFEIENMPTRDHIIPISKGGDNIKENVIPACKSCNCSKQDKDLIMFKKEVIKK